MAEEGGSGDAAAAAAAAAAGAGDGEWGLTANEYTVLKDVIEEYHKREVPENHCWSMVVQRIKARVEVVWSVVSRFDKPQTYKHFVRSCEVVSGWGDVGSVREVTLVSGIPASTSTERLELLDQRKHVIGFRVLGGQHRLHNYNSVTSLNQFSGGSASAGDREENRDEIWTVALESYVVAVPEGNTVDDTRLFADTVVRCNLQSLAQVSEHHQRDQVRRSFAAF